MLCNRRQQHLHWCWGSGGDATLTRVRTRNNRTGHISSRNRIPWNDTSCDNLNSRLSIDKYYWLYWGIPIVRHSDRNICQNYFNPFRASWLLTTYHDHYNQKHLSNTTLAENAIITLYNNTTYNIYLNIKELLFNTRSVLILRKSKRLLS